MTTFLDFQKEVEARSQRKQQEQIPISSSISKLQVAPGAPLKDLEQSDTRDLLSRLLEPRESSALVQHLQTRLSRNRELLLRLSYPGNLASHHWDNLFDPEDQVLKNEAWKLSQEQTDLIIQTLNTAASEIGAQAGIVYSPLIHHRAPSIPLKAGQSPDDDAERNESSVDELWSAKGLRVFIRSVPQDASDAQELRVAVTGNVDSGKSTLLGVLVRGHLDDGRGRARVALFRHQHEIETGRTSSVGLEIMGFDASSKIVTPDLTNHEHGIRRQQVSWEQISARAAKIASFIDLAGHERYFKSTVFGLTGHSPDYVILVIGSNAGLIGMSKEHLAVALALSVPVICVITKTDMTPLNIQQQTRKQLVKILKSPGCRKNPVYVKDNGMAVELAQNVREKNMRLAPIFEVSNVEGRGLDELRCFLNCLPAPGEERYLIEGQNFEFSISECFSVPFTGAVCSGVVEAGTVRIGDNVMIGPDSVGQWISTQVKSIQRKRVPVSHAAAGQSVSFALKRIKRNQMRKGMLLVGINQPTPKSVRRFEATVLVLYHNTTIANNYQSMLHVSAIRQTVRIVEIIDKKVLRTGDKATVLFEFISQPEAVREGQKILFREGKTKGLGVITKIY